MSMNSENSSVCSVEDENCKQEQITISEGSGNSDTGLSDEDGNTQDNIQSTSESSHHFNKRLIAIEYPGIVQNLDKMLDTLGGIENISRTYYAPANRRLELRFRPSDVYCKPTCAEKAPTTGLLLRLRVKKKPKDLNQPGTSKDQDEEEPIVTSVKVIGVVESIYRFTNLCDFQYLPVQLHENNEMENIYDKLIPQGMPDSSWLDKEDSVPYFLPPPSFSRIDAVDGYMFGKDNKNDPHKHQHIIGRTRRRRSGHAKFMTFGDEKTPDKPHRVAVNLLRLKFITDTHQNAVKKLFNERPIWSRQALLYETKFSVDQIKYILPTVAYYVMSGPWRVMWIKFGYDPRKDPTSRKYQTLDYRIKLEDSLKNMIKVKRATSNYILPYRTGPSIKNKKKTVQLNNKPNSSEHSGGRSKTQIHAEYCFEPGTIPTSRQMFYQYCDLHVPEIEAMLARLPEPTSDAVCSEKTGWMPSGIDERCREIISELITIELKKSAWKMPKPQEESAEWEDESGSEEEGDPDWDDSIDI